MPRYKEADRQEIREQTRQALLQAATAEFAREGFERANINHISQAAGFAKGTVYNYFDSKRALMLALIDEIAQAHFDDISAQVAQEEAPTCRLERFFEAGFAWVTNHLDQARVMFATLNSADPEFKLAMYEAYQPMFQLVGRDILAIGVERGVFRPVEPAAAARLLMTVYLGVGSQVNEQGKHWFSPQQVADLLLDGLRRQNESDDRGSK
jgi:AcrR family transcriptional regulator